MKKNQSVNFYAVLLMVVSMAAVPLFAQPYEYKKANFTTKRVHRKAQKFVNRVYSGVYPISLYPNVRVDSVLVDKKERQIHVFYNRSLSCNPLRNNDIRNIYEYARRSFGWFYRKYSLTLYSINQPIEYLVPNYYRDRSNYDYSRMVDTTAVIPDPIVRDLSRPFDISSGLSGRHIALWHSHGWYYNNEKDRWEWERPRLFQTVEDMFPMSFTVPYLIPMLENAGANVFIPRERDLQLNEVIVDNDSDIHPVYIETGADQSHFFNTVSDTGFAVGNPPYFNGENPFKQGTFRNMKVDNNLDAEIRWIPEIPETGKYSVQIAYQTIENSISDARYTVYSKEGKSEYLVNQQMGGGTWIYLGTFEFEQGRNPEQGMVVLTNDGADSNGVVTADAVKFGGGMGNVGRNGQVSRRPRYLEASRYYLQYAGMHDTLVYNLNMDTLDYNDDYQSRGEWVNYLKGNPFGPNRERSVEGLGIPIDISLAFHTDAGITRNGMAIGTLSIYSVEGADTLTVFPDGMSRLANRDFADLLQTQLVDDIRHKYDPVWPRRALLNAPYSEAYRPNVPAALLELLSHQNFLDMKFGLDPRFRFDVGRSIYKSMLRFLSTQYQVDYVVQPLPVDSLQVVFNENSGLRLSWTPVYDPLEETAVPDKYLVKTRLNDGIFDQGIIVNEPEHVVEQVNPGMIYSFQVYAINDGGISFPSEIVSAGWSGTDLDTVLIVSGFDRISAPASVESSSMLGFTDFIDEGVPDRYSIDYTGTQYDYNPASKFINNDVPGHGSSFSDYETNVITGNTRDYAVVHGKSILESGRSFVTVSDEVVSDSSWSLDNFRVIDYLLGEEKETDWPRSDKQYPREKIYKTFPGDLQSRIVKYLDGGGKLFISGSHIGSDLFQDKEPEHMDIAFATDTLKINWIRNNAARTGSVFGADSLFKSMITDFEFNTRFVPEIYKVEAPDAIEPVPDSSHCILRYGENHFSAGVGYKGNYDLVIFGFPFETITSQADRNMVMDAVLKYLNSDYSTLTPAEVDSTAQFDLDLEFDMSSPDSTQVNTKRKIEDY